MLWAALTMENFKTASVKDYMITLDGKQYKASLPHPIRPSSLATKTSEDTLVFFSKFSPLSNHAPSIFEYEGKIFHNMEQFLAFNRALNAQQTNLADRALQTSDPVEAKAILNSLRKTHIQEWQEVREGIALEGLRAKFIQNPSLAGYLRSTRSMKIGEASKNPAWGVAMILEDKNILNSANWNESGNLLGKLLMQVRGELQQLNAQ